MREVLAYLMVIGMSSAFLWHFSCIIRFKTYTIQEPSQIALISEIILFSACLIYGIVNFVRLMRRK